MDPITYLEVVELLEEWLNGSGLFVSFGLGLGLSFTIGVWTITRSTVREVDE